MSHHMYEHHGIQDTYYEEQKYSKRIHSNLVKMKSNFYRDSSGKDDF